MLKDNYFREKYIWHVSDWSVETKVQIMKKDGSAFVQIYWYDDDPDKTLYVSDLHVRERERGKGIGREILCFVEMIARNKGCSNISLTVSLSSWMHEWYKRLGFVFYKYASDYYVWMEKKIQ